MMITVWSKTLEIFKKRNENFTSFMRIVVISFEDFEFNWGFKRWERLRWGLNSGDNEV